MSTQNVKTLSDWEPFISGKEFTKETPNVNRLQENLLDRFMEELNSDTVANTLFKSCDDPRGFFNAMVDFKSWIPKTAMKELFYAAKLKKYSLSVPCFAQFLLERAWSLADGIPNMIIKLLPTAALTELCSKDYFLGGMSLHDVICNVCTEDYTPLCEHHLRNKLQSFTEIYVMDTDMVAAVPHEISDALSDEAIRSIKLTAGGLAVGDRLLSTFGGHFGATHSNYDLRDVV